MSTAFRFKLVHLVSSLSVIATSFLELTYNLKSPKCSAFWLLPTYKPFRNAY